LKGFEFLELEGQNFKKYKEKLTKSKYEHNISLNSFRTINIKKHCEIKKKENLKNADDIKKKRINYQKFIKNKKNLNL
jgi:hypothetical protein